MKYFKFWSVPNNSSPDVYGPYSKSRAFQYDNKWWTGTQYPKTGETYIGIEVFGANDHEYREYIETPLLNPLKAGHKYCFSMFTSLAKNCKFASDGLDIFVSSINLKTDDRNLFRFNVTPTLSKLGGINIETNNWLLVCGSFIAKGGEQYLYIGNFKNDKNTTLRIVKKAKKDYELDENYRYAYYYIDDVSLVEISDKDNCDCNLNNVPLNFNDTTSDGAYNKIPTIPAGVSFTIPNLYFKTDKWDILKKSYPNLDSLYRILSENIDINILITGHTDNSGKEEYNLQLSINRAKAVADYLIDKGILPKRIKYEGKGSSYPIATNDTDEGKEMNRRVEITISRY